jgi:hypothetical protein
MDPNKNLEAILILSLILGFVILLAKISYLFLAIPAILLLVGLASDKLAKGILITLQTSFRFIIQFFIKLFLSFFFFFVLLTLIFFQGILQKSDIH